MVGAKQRYDAKRKGDAERLRKERARNFIRLARRDGKLMSLGGCSMCKAIGTKTVWHHPNYQWPGLVMEVCYPCHRALHPRPTPKKAKVV